MTTSAAQDAEALWSGLNARQRTWLAVIFDEDQAAEAAQKATWFEGGRRTPASEWRWLPYGPVGNTFGAMGTLQQRLQAAGVRDKGAGATITALENLELIETRQQPAVFADYCLEIQLTRLGRAVCRAGGLDPDRPVGRAKGMLSETLWRMLAEVWAAGPDGKPVRYIGGAWTRLTDREPEPLVEAELGAFERNGRMRLTDAGRAHYRDLWLAYARAYPSVQAQHPDGADPWPAEVDDQLRCLALRCKVLRAEITATLTVPDTLDELAAVTAPTVPSPGDREEGLAALPAELRAVLQRRDTAAAACQTAADRAAARYADTLAKATGRYRDVLDTVHTDLQQPYRDACARYVLAAAAVCQAAADSEDPVAALDVDQAAVDAAAARWPLPPDTAPVTGLPEVDTAIEQARLDAGGRKPGKRRSRRPARAGAGGGGRQLLDEGAHLTRYADAIARYVKGGRLTRLLLRRPTAREGR